MLYEIHMLKNYPASNLNRDDAGSPKTVVFGNTTRGRISSQCLKRSWRTSDLFRDAVGETNLGIRTRKFPVLVKDKMIELGVSEEVAEACMPVLSSGLANKEGKTAKDVSMTAQVIFYAPDDIDAVAEACKSVVEKYSSVAKLKKELKASDILEQIGDRSIRPITVDIALFGRMVTSNAYRDVDACVQVSHAFTTGKITADSDFFTAMDDLLTGDSMAEGGAGMIGDQEFVGGSCFYSYANVDSDALLANLSYAEDAEDLVKKTIPALLKAMIFSNPSGKQNSHAGHALPSVIMVECKDTKIPVNLANAFVSPVNSADTVKESAMRLADETDMVARNYGLPVKHRFWFIVDKYDIKPETATKICANVQELIDAVSDTL